MGRYHVQPARLWAEMDIIEKEVDSLLEQYRVSIDVEVNHELIGAAAMLLALTSSYDGINTLNSVWLNNVEMLINDMSGREKFYETD